jgi:hypothetical protein
VRRRALFVVPVVVVLLCVCGWALGAWTGMVDGTAAARSQSLAGNKPSGSVSGANVTVSWAASLFSDGTAADSYTVRRYQAVTGTEQTVLAGCAGSLAATSCTENAVPAGSWQYAVTPRYGDWRGTESAKSDVVVVVAATVVDSTAPTTTASASPAANAAGWRNADVTVSLSATDPAPGVVKQVTYAVGGASNTTVPGSSATVPAIATEGTISVNYFAEDEAGNVESTKTLTVKLDKTAPATATLTALPAKVRNGQSLTGSFADAGSGIASVTYYYCLAAAATCDASSGTGIGSSATSPYSVTWNSQPADGSYKVVANAVDAAGNAKLSDVVTTTVDNTAPTAIDVQATAATAAGANTIGSGDVIKLTFSEVMSPGSVKSGWDGSSTSVTGLVKVTNGTTDFISFATGIELGTVDLGSAAWAKAGNGNEYALNGTLSMATVNGRTVLTISITSNDTKAETVTGSTTLKWTPSAGATDAAGNPATTAQATESGSADVDF